MFSFHKPKIYRSINGCCICRAKSSSSRFTDSKRYECEFEKCFRIREKRAGEICNACVLLVKRWKKLPEGTSRHWHHVSFQFKCDDSHSSQYIYVCPDYEWESTNRRTQGITNKWHLNYVTFCNR